MTGFSDDPGMPRQYKSKARNPRHTQFSRRLVLIRERAGFESAADFARHLGIELETYRRYERGETEPSIGTIIKILKAARESADYLILGDAKDRDRA